MAIKVTAADRYFSLAIRNRSGWVCERCLKQYTPPAAGLECAHWHSRGNWSVRFDTSNALSLCTGCHFYTAMNRETEHRPLMLKIMGDMELDRLAFDKNRPASGIRKRVKEIAAHYKAEVERLKSLRDSGVTGRLEIEGWFP